MIEVEEKYMARCIALAKGGKGYTSPNPMVGAVIVHEGRVIGEGFHRRCGEAHAEVNAIASVKDESLLRNSTIYVSLEPCSHYGKTPPCADLIVRKGIPRVVVGCMDPFPAVSGRGVRRLREAGVEVVTGVMEREARALNKTFMTLQTLGRPYVILKWAQSADGFIDRERAGVSEPATVFSTPATTRWVHKLRSEVAAIMVGKRTALLDDPSLNVRNWYGHNPLRVVLDRRLEIPSAYHLLDGSTPTLVFTEKTVENPPHNVAYVRIDFSQSVVRQVLDELATRKIDSLLVEGGASMIQSFVAAGTWDEARIETSPLRLGDGVKSPSLGEGAIRSIDDPSIQYYKNQTYAF